MNPQFVVAVGYHHTMAAASRDPERARDHFRTALHHAVSDWLRNKAGTRFPMAWKTADLVVAEKTADPQVSVVYLTAAQLLEYRARVSAQVGEHVRAS